MVSLFNLMLQIMTDPLAHPLAHPRATKISVLGLMNIPDACFINYIHISSSQ